MRRVLQLVSTIVVVLSLLFLVYGFVKLARVEAEPNRSIEVGIPGVEIVQSHSLINKENSQLIIGIAFVALTLGGIGFSLSSKNQIEEDTSK